MPFTVCWGTTAISLNWGNGFLYAYILLKFHPSGLKVCFDLCVIWSWFFLLNKDHSIYHLERMHKLLLILTIWSWNQCSFSIQNSSTSKHTLTILWGLHSHFWMSVHGHSIFFSIALLLIHNRICQGSWFSYVTPLPGILGCARCVKVLKSHDYLSFSHCLT